MRDGRRQRRRRRHAVHARGGHTSDVSNPLGKLPGSVWTIPTQPLHVPAELGVDHFAAFPTEWPRRHHPGLVAGRGLHGLRRRTTTGRADAQPVARPRPTRRAPSCGEPKRQPGRTRRWDASVDRGVRHGPARITGYACACPDTTAPTTPGVVLDPFGGTGTTALVATALGRHGISVDMSADY